MVEPVRGQRLRFLSDDSISVGLNISGEPRLWNCEACGELLMSTHLDRDGETVMGPILLRGNQASLCNTD